MKAKIIDTCFYNKTRLTIGEIVEIVPGMETDAEGIWNAPAGKLFLCKKQDGTFAYSLPQDLQLLPEGSNDANWSAFRREAAKDILCSLLGRVERIYTSVKSEGSRVTDHRDFIRVAIEDADELIKQLREGKE